MRFKGARRLENLVVVQSDQYEGAFYVTPFLIQMLRIEATGAAEILDLLFEIANGFAEAADLVAYSLLERPFAHCVPNEQGLVEPLAIACRGAVLRGFSCFLARLQSADTKVKENALELLRSFVEFRALMDASLTDALEIEPDAAFRTKIENVRDEFRR